MMMRLYFAFVFGLISTIAQAETIGCPGKVNHILLEVGHDEPYPYLIPPNMGTDKDPPEWDLSGRREGIEITVHCFPTEDENVKTDVVIPPSVKFCGHSEDHFWCR